MSLLFENNAVATIATEVSGVATTVHVSSGEGSRFPSITGGDKIRATLSGPNGFEIVEVSERDGDTFTIETRELEGTTAKVFPASTSTISIRITKGLLEQFPQITEPATVSGEWTFDTVPSFPNGIQVNGQTHSDVGPNTTVGNQVLAPYRNLSVVRDVDNSNNVDVTADALIVEDQSGGTAKLTGISLTVVANAQGVNGVDHASAAEADTWYDLWVIYNGTTISGLFARHTEGITDMPAGYTYKGLVGTYVISSIAGLVKFFFQVGNDVSFTRTAILDNAQRVSGHEGSVSTLAFVAPNARIAHGVIQSNANTSTEGTQIDFRLWAKGLGFGDRKPREHLYYTRNSSGAAIFRGSFSIHMTPSGRDLGWSVTTPGATTSNFIWLNGYTF